MTSCRTSQSPSPASFEDSAVFVDIVPPTDEDNCFVDLVPVEAEAVWSVLT